MSFDEFELQQTLNATYAQANDALNAMRAGIANKAKTAAKYDTLLATTRQRLRNEGMSVTMAKEIAKGDPDVTAAYVEMVIADETFQTDREELLLRKKEAGSIQAQIDREWSQSGRIF